MTSQANYAKYEKMSRKQLLSSLASLEKKQEALALKQRENRGIIKFLKVKLKKSEEKYYTLENCPASYKTHNP